MGNSSWAAASEADRETAKRKAAQYLDLQFSQRWRGERANETQALAWPRSGVYDDDGYAIDSDSIPQKLKDAEAVAALLYEAAHRGVAGDSLQEFDLRPTHVEHGHPHILFGCGTDPLRIVAQKPAEELHRLV